jgi:hypothetical protein
VSARELLLGLVLAASVAGCGGGASICDDICECTGECTDDSRAECVDNYEDAEKYADDEECGAEFDAYTSCISSEFECRSGKPDADGCVSEGDELQRCLPGRGGR